MNLLLVSRIAMTDQKCEERKDPCFKRSFPVSFQLFRSDTQYHQSQPIEAIATGIRGIVGSFSFEGLQVEANPTKEQIDEIMGMNTTPAPFFMEIETNLIGEEVKIVGEVVSYDVSFPNAGPCYFRADVFLGQLDGNTRQLWDSLIDSLI